MTADGEAPADITPPADITLSDDEASAVIETALAFAAALPAERQTSYRALAASASEGIVPADQVDDLERVCALSLETGKARQIGKAEAEQYLAALYRRTPSGQALQAEVLDINKALRQLSGRTLESARLTWKMPGRYGLSITVSGVDLVLAIEPDGVHVQTLQAG